MRTTHGSVETPAFMPVATHGTVRAMTPRDLREVGTSILLANAYHLYLRPGARLIEELGGLHRFMNWEGPILTDSGGYQVYSLRGLVQVGDAGIRIRSHVDGSRHELTPEDLVEIQERLGVDIAMVLDECVPASATYAEAERAGVRTIAWAERSLAARTREETAAFAIVQGGLYRDLRSISARTLVQLDFSGYAVGGLSVGEDPARTADLAEFTVRLLPATRPRYLMGVGTPAQLVRYVTLGFDLFDCVIPTRNARNGGLFTGNGKLNIRRTQYARDPRPVEENCSCYTCRNFSRAYLRHLALAGEILSSRLNTLHNLFYYQRLMAGVRQALAADRFSDFARPFLADTNQPREEPVCQP